MFVGIVNLSEPVLPLVGRFLFSWKSWKSSKEFCHASLVDLPLGQEINVDERSQGPWE
jgi:hypothetical protein